MRHAQIHATQCLDGSPITKGGGNSMRGLVVGAIGARIAIGVTAGATVLLAGGALAAAAPAAAASRGAAPACTVSWVGRAAQPDWTNPQNWSTRKVPGPSDDVCITRTGDDVLTNVSIKIHSLTLGVDQGLALEGTASHPLTATVATSVTFTPGLASRIDLIDASVSAAQINNRGGTIFSSGTCSLTSPDISFSDGAELQAANGTTTLSSLAQLSNGTLTGGTFDTSDAAVVLPGDISHLVAAHIGVGGNSAIKDPAGHNALASLTSIDAQSALADFSGLALTGGLTASGDLSIDGQNFSVAGPLTQTGGTLSVQSGSVLSATGVTIGAGAALNADQATIAANLVNDGTAEVGNLAPVNVAGSYTQAPGASLTEEFGGPLEVTGKATLAGAVSVSQELPQPGDSTPVVSFGSLSGGFTSHSIGIRLVTKPGEIDGVILPQIAASPATVAPGAQLTVNGGSFTLESTVRIFLDNTNGTPLASAAAGGGGRFVATVTIPAATAAGSHKLIAVGSDGNRAATTIKVS